MKERVNLSVFEIVGSELCVASGDGQKVYERLVKAMEESGVTLSFRNVTLLTCAFLNTAIGQLYGKFSEDKIRESLTVRDMESDDMRLLKRVVDNAKQYFKDPEKFNRTTREAHEEI